MHEFIKTEIETLKNGGIGVIPTDTLYGIVGNALIKKTVERVYTVRNRDEKKPCIVLVASYEQIAQCGGILSTKEHTLIEEKKLWPGKISIILPCPDPRFTYLTRGTETIAFRMPETPALRELLHQTGPLIAPSANTEGNPPAKTIEEARAYFGDAVDFYIDAGTLISEPSTLISFTDGDIHILRQGAYLIQ